MDRDGRPYLVASARGAYLIRLFLGGRWRAVIVDPNLPISGEATKILRGANAKLDHRRGRGGADEYALAYSRAAGNQLWVPLVEKAYAKAHGSYHAISGGWISEGLLDLTGCPTETIELDATVAEGGFDSEQAWLRMLSYAAAGFPMGCATQGDPTHRSVGLVGNHAYSVMEVRELHGEAVGRQTKLTDAFVKKKKNEGDDDEVVCTGEYHHHQPQQQSSNFGVSMEGGSGGDNGSGETAAAAAAAAAPLRLLRIRNPWGRKEWSGEWGVGSDVWTKKLGSVLSHTRADDGTFWMSWHDFLCRFTMVDVCKAHKGWCAISLPAAVGGGGGGGVGGGFGAAVGEDATFEVEIAPASEDEGDGDGDASSSWAYVMALQKNKRGARRGNFWYADVGIAIYASAAGGGSGSSSGGGGGGYRPSWVPIGGKLGARERVGQVEMMFEPKTRYIVRLFSIAGGGGIEGPAPTVLRLYSARPLRVRRASSPPPPLAPAIHLMLMPRGGDRAAAGSSTASSAATSALCGFLGGGGEGTNGTDRASRRHMVPLCGGALVICQTRGGVFVVAVNTGGCAAGAGARAGAGAAALKVWLRVSSGKKGRNDKSVVYQYPPPPAHPAGPSGVIRGGYHDGGGCGGGGGGGVEAPVPFAALHEIPAGRMRVLAVSVSVGPSDSCKHSLEIAAEQAGNLCAACEAKRRGDGEGEVSAKEGGGGGGGGGCSGGGDGGDGDDVGGKSPEVVITGETRGDANDDGKQNKKQHDNNRRGEGGPSSSSLFPEFPALPPPPPGVTDAELAAMLAKAIAEAAAEEEAEEEEEEEDVVIVRGGEVKKCLRRNTHRTNNKINNKEEEEEKEVHRPARPPPRHLAQLFAHIPAPELVLRETRAASRCGGGGGGGGEGVT